MDARQGSTIAEAAGAASFTPRQLRMLKASIAVMSTILVVGFAVIVGRIAYLVSHGGTKPLAPAARTQLALPAGAAVRAISLSGERVAVHYEAPTGAGIAILDIATGKPVTHVELSREE